MAGQHPRRPEWLFLAVYSGTGCTGTEYIPAAAEDGGGSGPPSAAGKLLRFRAGGNYVAADGSEETILLVNSYLSVDSGCIDFPGPTTSLVWATKTLTPSQAGLPDSITGPLSISSR